MKTEEKPKKTTDKDLIKRRLITAHPSMLAVHEFGLESHGVSQNTIGTRLPEMAIAGITHSRFRQGERFKEWGLMPAHVPNAQQQEFFS